MIKPKAFIDFDSTLVNSVKAFCKVYSEKYKYFKDFTEPIHTQVYKWNLTDQCTLIQNNSDVEEIFASKRFFQQLEPFPNVIQSLKKLQEKYDITIVSIGNHKNIAYKCDYIHNNFSFIKGFIGIVNEHSVMDKSSIFMDGTNEKCNIFIDDNADNLFSQNHAKNLIRYCYADNGEKEWNKAWLDINGRQLTNWSMAEKILMNPEWDKY